MAASASIIAAEVGPVSFQSPNGVIDILVEDEEEATSIAQKYLSYFSGRGDRLGGYGQTPAPPAPSPRTGFASTTSAA